MNNFDPSNFIRGKKRGIEPQKPQEPEQIQDEELETIQQEPEKITEDENTSNEKTFDPSQYTRTKKETWPQWFQRNQTRGSLRVGEAFFGTPGNVKDFLKDLSQSAMQESMDEETFANSVQQLENIDKIDPKIRDILFEQPIGDIPLPSTKDLRKAEEGISSLVGKKNYLEPKNYWEEKGDEVLSDFGSLLFPGSGGQTILQKLGTAVAGTLGKEALELFGADNKQKEYGKLGLMFGLDLATRGHARNHAAGLLRQAEQSIPQNATIDASGLLTQLDQLENRIRVGGVSPSDRPALQLIDSIRARIDPANPIINARELPAMNRNINEVRGNIGAFEMPRNARPRATRHVNDVHGVLGDTIEQYGQRNPQFLNLWARGNEAYAVWAQSNAVSNFIQKNYTKPIVSDATKILFFSGAGQSAKNFPAAAASLSVAAAPYQAMKMLYRVMNSPELRSYYMNVVSAATAGNIGLMNKNISLLDKALEKKEAKKTEELSRKKKLS